MRNRTLWLATLICFLATATASAGDYMTRGKKNRQYAEPDEQHAVVYVVRGSAVGMAIRFWTFAGDQPIGLTRGRTYFVAKVPAGETLFWSKAENVSTLKLDIEAGKTYFLKQGVRMGIGKARVELMQLDEEKGRKLIVKLPYSALTEEGVERGMEIVAKRHPGAVRKSARR